MARVMFVLWLTTAAWVVGAGASDWTTCVNDRFGTTADIPVGCRAGEAPDKR